MNNGIIFPINTGAGGDTVKGAVEKIRSELAAIYSITNGLHRLWAGATPPAGAQTGDVHLYSGATGYQLKVYNGSSWIDLGASGKWGAGVNMDNGLSGYTRNVIPARYSASQVLVTSSAEHPSTLWVPDSSSRTTGLLLQNTGGVGAQVTAGTWKIYAYRDGGTSNFLIGVTTGELGFGQIQIGECKHDGTDFVYIIPFELYPELRIATMNHNAIYGNGHLGHGAFKFRLENALHYAAEASATRVITDAKLLDQWGAFNSTYNCFQAPRAGYWEIHGAVEITPTHSPYTVMLDVSLRKGTGTFGSPQMLRTARYQAHNPLKENPLDNTVTFATAPDAYSIGQVSGEVSGIFSLAVGDMVAPFTYVRTTPRPQAGIENPPTIAAVAADSVEDKCAIWGRYLGPA